MKKYLVASVTALIVFAFAAMAASLSVGSSMLAAGQGDVTGCTEDSVDVTYSYNGGDLEWNGSAWTVNQADVVLDEACIGLTTSFALEGIVGSTTVVTETGTATFSFADTDPEAITGHSIVVRD